MSYLTSSLKSKSYWRYALFSRSAFGKILATAGGLFLFVEMLDFFHLYTRDKYSKYAFVLVLLFSALIALVTRRPVSRVAYKIPSRDLVIEVMIGDIFDADGALVISTSTTFDTDMANATISPDSLQGQVALKCFQGNTAEIDRQLDSSLSDRAFIGSAVSTRKEKDYPLGTVAKVGVNGRTFYFVAMSKWNENGNAYSTVPMLDEALDGLWDYAATRGELLDISIPLMGTGRGRIQLPRKKVIERIAQSFLYASTDQIFCKKLKIVVRPSDAESAGLNLFEVRDYLVESLHI